ncbi:methyl-accepting chemotaxis sensory transducer, putative [Babesia ovata]|uniref:Methyl-accepting chemotaxis sensory transducer, putative n=1 Tax=Babesia ovata TaxID=189622 RepID=A0A2H6KIM8_9APIC|nr:methyl-accepting chemotaxis sensory transducer, putative [Babesia ovata]GBE62845.1 methyl-accepting chemotaxis sensory transducer, putative [Babesia ovata]
MDVAEPFGQHFAQLLACPRTSRETPEAERSETGRAKFAGKTRLTYRLTADKSEHDKQSTEDMQHHVQAIVGVLRVIQLQCVAIEVNGVRRHSVAVAEHPGEQGRGVGGDIVKGGGQICGGD